MGSLVFEGCVVHLSDCSGWRTRPVRPLMAIAEATGMVPLRHG